MRTFFIDGEEVTVDKSWTISDRINSRSTLSVMVVDLGNLERIDEGDSFEIFEGVGVLFSGIILTIEKQEQIPGKLFYALSVIDNSARADKRRIAKVYENEYAGDIVLDLIAEKLADEGVTAGNIAQGPLIKKAVFNYLRVSEALEYLKKVTGYNWNIDSQVQLNFFERSEFIAPFVLSDSVPHASFRQRSTMDRYRNVQYLRGGTGKTSPQTDETPTPKPDGVSRSFVLRFPVAEKPVIEVDIGAGFVAVDPSDIGVNGVDTGKEWYFSLGTQTISQDDNETVLGTSDAIRVSYRGLRNLFIALDDTEQIADRAAKETGTSGIYEDLAVEKSINEADQAIEVAQGLMDTFGEVLDSISFTTHETGLQSGQLLSVQKPLYSINESFLIENVTVRPDGPMLQYTINALDSPSIGGWEEFFRNLVRADKDFVIAENEVIILLANNSDRSGWSGSTLIEVFEPFPVSEDVVVSESLVVGPKKGESTIND